MGIFSRLRRLISSNVNDLVRKAENPEKTLNQLVSDMNKQLLAAKRNVATAIAEEKQLERQLEKQRTEISEWDRRAMVALKAGKEDLAREALTRKKREQQYVGQLEEQYAKQHEGVEALKHSLRDLSDRIEEAQRKKNLLVARAKRAEAQKNIQELISGLGDTSAFAAFDEMAQRVEQIETENEVMHEIGQATADRSLEARIDELEGESTDEMLEDLRHRAAETDVSVTVDVEVEDSLAELKRRLQSE